MTDFADEASERTEAQIAEALANRMPEGPKATGWCLECGEDLSGRQTGRKDTLFVIAHDRRWCDAHCRDLWENRQR